MTCAKLQCSDGVVFFFQAEDGIRDLTVTGVQTCALPISSRTRGRPPRPPGRGGWPSAAAAVLAGDAPVHEHVHSLEQLAPSLRVGEVIELALAAAARDRAPLPPAGLRGHAPRPPTTASGF